MGHHLIDAEISRARRLAAAAWEHRSDSARALVEASQAVRAANRDRDPAAAAIADRAAAVALFETGQTASALRRARRGLAAARESGDPVVTAGALITLGGGLCISGRLSESLEVLDEACASAVGGMSIDARAQRAVALNQLGRRREALAELSSLLDRDGPDGPDGLQRAELLHDQGVVLAFLTRFAEAEQAFRCAAELFDGIGQAAAAFDARRNLALSYVQSARLPQALRLFDELERESGSDRQQLVWLQCVQMEALLAANLRSEAVDVAERLLETARGASADVRAEAWRLCAQAFAADGDLPRSAEIARRAERLFRQQGFVPFAAIARRSWAAALPPRRRAAVLGKVIAELEAAGLRSEAVMTRADRLLAAIEAGLPTVVADERSELSRERRRGGTVIVRLHAWLGESRALSAEADHRRAARAARSGLRLLDEHRSSLGGTELRAHASGIGEELARIGMTAALAEGRPGEVFAAAERWRANTVLARPSGSSELDEALAELRSLLALSDGSPGAELDPVAIERRTAAAEERVRRIARGLAGQSGSEATVPRLEAVRRVLGQRSLIELIEHRGSYVAVVAEPSRRARLVVLGDVETVARAAADLAFALRRLSRRGISALAAGAAAEGVHLALAEIDRCLIRPLGLAAGPKLVVPPASLHTVPFPALSSLSDDEVTVAPSSTWWMRTAQHASATGSDRKHLALIGGPGLAGAEAEVAELGAADPSAWLLAGADATMAAVGRALDGARFAHLACHGHLRADHPHLSSLELFDGPFTVYDFERLTDPPRQVVLAACDSAVGAQRPGDELLGFVSALLGLGTRDVLASVVPVPDLATTELMTAFHAAVRGGRSFPVALGAARRAIDTSIPANLAASVAFVAFGIGT